MGNQVYDKFEDKLRRWEAAERLVTTLSAEIRSGREPWDDRWSPSDDEVNRLIGKSVTPDVIVCQAKDSGQEAACLGPERCGRRCAADYWLAHGEDVATSMAQLARLFGEDERTWFVVGRIHDIDYPKNPHHDASVPSENAHPLGVAHELYALGAAPAVVLAVLTHAPHLRLRPASPLAWALLACDEHATMTGYVQHDPAMRPTYPQRLETLASLLKPATSTIRGGFRREDMQDRANLGLLKLLYYQKGKIPRFDNEAFANRIDWYAEVEAAFPQ